MTADELDRNGFAIVRGVLTPEECSRWAEQIERLLSEPSSAAIGGPAKSIVGGRNLQQQWSGWRELMRRQAIGDLLTNQLGESFGLVRILFFDKPPGQSWNLALHRDKTIAVDRHHEPPQPYAKPTTKAGVKHVEANESLLERMLTLRVHLDAMHQGNGPLIVVPASHQNRDGKGDELVRDVVCECGDVFVMKPLLLHGSRACRPDCQDHRRVVHLEFAPKGAIESPYRWHCYDTTD